MNTLKSQMVKYHALFINDFGILSLLGLSCRQQALSTPPAPARSLMRLSRPQAASSNLQRDGREMHNSIEDLRAVLRSYTRREVYQVVDRNNRSEDRGEQ